MTFLNSFIHIFSSASSVPLLEPEFVEVWKMHSTYGNVCKISNFFVHIWTWTQQLVKYLLLSLFSSHIQVSNAGHTVLQDRSQHEYSAAAY